MATDSQFSEAFQLFAVKENLPTRMDSEELSMLPRELRERSFFMSTVVDAEILDRFRMATEDFVAGKKDRNTLYKELYFWLEQKGYNPPSGKAGGLKDLMSLRRISVVLNTNRDMARGHAQWVRRQKTLRVFPARQLVRVSDRIEKRQWPSVWIAAMDRLGDRTLAKRIEKPGGVPNDPISHWILVAPVNDPIWIEISAFQQPYPPYDWGSGVGDKDVPLAQAKEWGVVPPKDSEMAQPQDRSLNESLEMTPDVSTPEAKEALSDQLGRFGEWDGNKMIFTDPDGTRPYPATKLAEIWAKPAPEGYDHLSQRDELATWDGGDTPVNQAARVTLRRLFDRIENDEELPQVLHRSHPLDVETAAEMIQGLKDGLTLGVPADRAGWSFDKVLRTVSVPDGGWVVNLTVKGVTLAKDVRALRPDKPGFVYVGGKRFRVVDFKLDAGKRTIAIELEEGDQP